MGLEQCRQCEQCGQGQFDLVAQIDLRSGGFKHPQRDLERAAIRMADCHREMCLARPGNDLKRPELQRVERVMDRHSRRQGS